jgi:hypothetical protein
VSVLWIGGIKQAVLPGKQLPQADKSTVASQPVAKDTLSTSADAKWHYRGTSSGYQINWRSDDLEAWRAQDMSQTEPVFSVRKNLDEYCKDPEEGQFMCAGERRTTVQMTSLVGKYLGVLETDSGYVPGAAHDWASTDLQTINLDTGKPVKLTDVFPEKDIYQALMNDPVVKKALNGAKPRNLAELKTAVGRYRSEDGRFTLEGLGDNFSFHHVKGDKVAVRVSLPYGVEAWRGNLTQLGLYLPIPEGLRRDLHRASTAEDGTGLKQGMLWDEAERKFGNTNTFIELPPARSVR